MIYRVSAIGPNISLRRVFEERRQAEAWLTGVRDCYAVTVDRPSPRTRFIMRNEEGTIVDSRERGRKIDE